MAEGALHLDGVGLAPSRRRSATLVRSIRLGFRGSWPFRCEDPAHEGWISLDSLVRIETFQGLRSLKRGICFSALFRGVTSAGKGAAVEAMRKHRIVHGASLTQFLIFCKRLSSEPFPFGRLNPKAARSGEWSLRRSRTKCSRCIRPIVSTISINFAPFDRVHAARAAWTLGARRQQGPHWSASGARSPKKARRPAACIPIRQSAIGLMEVVVTDAR
jgi:hypothetical protein